MEYENFKIQVWQLEKAVNKLLKYGMQTFEMYADEIGISFFDRNLVIGKCRIAYGRTDLKEMECPPEMRQKRLDCYTRVYRYPEKKARQMIKEIDLLYSGSQSQSIGDIKSLTRGIG